MIELIQLVEVNELIGLIELSELIGSREFFGIPMEFQ